jgi:hypothetical protein
MVDFATAVFLAEVRLWVVRYTDYEYNVCIMAQNDYRRRVWPVRLGLEGGDMISQPEGNRQFGRQTRVDENLAYVVGLVWDSVNHAHTDCSCTVLTHLSGCSDAFLYGSVIKYHTSVGIAASYFVATVYQAVSSDLLHREVIVTETLWVYDTLHIMVM